MSENKIPSSEMMNPHTSVSDIDFPHLGRQEILVNRPPLKSTVFFDGSCPLCLAEIRHYRNVDDVDALYFEDISKDDAVLPHGLTRENAMRRFHVMGADGHLLSGAAAFVEVWKILPRWRWAVRLASLPGVMTLLEYGYRLFLPLRPSISRLFGALQKRFGSIDPADRR